MSYSDAMSYFFTLIGITLAPGPCVLMLIVRSASKDVLGAFGFGIGYALGGVIITSVVCFGLGTWLTAVPEFFEYSKYVMMAYILWLAYGVWKGVFDLEGECPSKRRPILSSLGAGILTCFISPYMMILLPLVLTSLMSTTAIELPKFIILVVITFATIVVCSVFIIALAAQISRLVSSPRSTMFLNRSLAGILVLGGGWMAFV
jgi:threonine/homoserine/homoserine lactone efflux protein